MKPRGTVLIVDDEAYVRDSLAAVLKRRGFVVRGEASVEAALGGGSLDGVDVVLSDLRMPGGDGLELVQGVAEAAPDLPVIVLTAHGSVPSAVECMRAGAFDYLLKPANPDELLIVIERALEQRTLRRELNYLRGAGGSGPAESRVVGSSPAWRKVMELVKLAAPSDTTILLTGESGTGKGELARLIHQMSRRAGAALVQVNCAAIPVELFESEFFGHRRGAFSGAVTSREGRFAVAHGGTLFMDEVACLPEPAQAKVLRVLEDGRFERLGDTGSSTVDVRLIAATNVDLEAEVEAGRFRRDLYYRINVFSIEVPPLRERIEDVPAIATRFLAAIGARLGKRIASIQPAALDVLCRYAWPGNVRELRNTIERAVILEQTAELQAGSLHLSGGGEPPEELNLRAAASAAERRALQAALGRAQGVRREAARLLGIDERNLAYYLRKHGLMRGGRA